MNQSAIFQRYLGPKKCPVLKQPLFFDSSFLNYRKLMELPHALAMSGRLDELQVLLCDLTWQQAVIDGFTVADLVSDFNYIVPLISKNK